MNIDKTLGRFQDGTVRIVYATEHGLMVSEPLEAYDHIESACVVEDFSCLHPSDLTVA